MMRSCVCGGDPYSPALSNPVVPIGDRAWTFRPRVTEELLRQRLMRMSAYDAPATGPHDIESIHMAFLADAAIIGPGEAVGQPTCPPECRRPRLFPPDVRHYLLRPPFSLSRVAANRS